MISFAYPFALTLLLFIPLFFVLRMVFPPSFRAVPFMIAQWKGRRTKGKGATRSLFGKIAQVLFWMGYVFCVLALAEPERIRTETLWLERGDNFIFVLDTSPSMAALDFPETRFGKAKALIRDFVRSRPQDSFGLVAFGRDAVLSVPPTRDMGFFQSKLDALAVASYGDGTAIGHGTALAAMHLESAKGLKSTIVLLTDGENNAGSVSPATAFSTVRRLGIALFVIGIGADGEYPISYTDPETGKTISGTYRSSYDSGALASLAADYGAVFIEAAVENAFSEAFNRLSAETARMVKSRKITVSDSISSWFLFWGLGIACIGLFLKRIVLGEIA